MTRVGKILFGLLALSFGCGASAGGAHAQARVSVSVPPSAKSASYVALDLSVRSLRKPATSAIAGVVRLGRAGSGNAVEVGRISLVSRSFNATSADQQQRFQFNVTRAVKQLDLAGGAAEVEVSLIDRASGAAPSGADIVIGSAQISVR